jgi:CxxC-x17-CxxC domain-containing protein
MNLQEKSCVCFDCGSPYTFTVEEQQAYEAKGHLHAPKRCPACRQTRKTRQIKSNNLRIPQPGIQSFPATCVQCGQSTTVPFEPKAGRPVYCHVCYRNIKVNR